MTGTCRENAEGKDRKRETEKVWGYEKINGRHKRRLSEKCCSERHYCEKLREIDRLGKHRQEETTRTPLQITQQNPLHLGTYSGLHVSLS